MKKYTALLFREWKITKKFYILRMFLFLFFVAMFALTFYGLTIQNEATPEGAYITTLVISSIFCLFSGVLATEDNGAYRADVNSGWLSYSGALPLTAAEKAFSKYLFRVIVILVGLGVSVLVVNGFGAIFGVPVLYSALYVYFWSINVVLIIDLIRQFVMMHAVDMKSLKKISNIGIIIFLALFFIPSGIFPESSLEKKMKAFDEMLTTMDEEAASLLLLDYVKELFTISHLWGCVGILLMIVLLIVSVVVVKRGYERRNV